MSATGRSHRRERGQAALKLLAALPALLVAALVAWQLVAVVAAGLRAQDGVRARALAAEPTAPIRTLTVDERVPTVVPGVHGLRIRAVAAAGDGR